MSVLKCSVCGGELDVNADLSVGVCKFCDSIITIPKELDRKGKLYNYANFLRQNNEFDKALTAYEDILKEDNSDAEAHWGLVLSKFGVEYVLDPKTQERIPTCHRTQIQSILADPDYLAAIEYSDIEAQRVIENEAKRINKIQTKILEISQKEEPYDIFICYKEADELGNRTEDSTIAQDLYYALKKKGYRVFFAKKSLRLGDEFEPIIFAALNSAKVMIVLGTKAEYFNAVWVRNEWSRFIHMSKDAHKMIIPAYRGMSPYELPAELSVLQSQDMSKIGFMQDLTDGIERCMRSEVSEKSEKKENAQSYETASLERLIKNGDTYLKLSNYSSAEEVYTTVTKEYPEDHRGWWGLIICKTRNFSDVILDQTSLNIWFRYVKQLASPKDFKELENQYVDYTKKVSQLATTEDMKVVNFTINKYNSEINANRKQIQTLNDQSKERENEWRRQNDFDLERIRKEEKNLTYAEKQCSRKAKGLTIGGILFTIGFIVLWLGTFNNEMDIFLVFEIGFIMGLTGFVFLIMNVESRNTPSFKTIDKFKSSARTNIQAVKKAQTVHKTQFDQDIASLRKAISDCERDIAILQGKIENCRRYLNLGKEKISELWFSKECEAFGVSKPFDSQIQEYRKAALDIAEKAVEDTVSVTCPACGEKMIESRAALLSNGYVLCKTCGNTIEVSVSSQPSSGSGINDVASDAFYRITCPACDREFNINNEILESGRCNCPSCGMKIEFEDAQ